MDSALSSTVPLTSQVGGHSGVLTTEDGSLLIKPALPLELQFYQALLADDALAVLHPFVPKFYGTLKLAGTLDEAQTGLSIVLENIAHRFARPNILDVKLGTVLHDEDAPPEKAARMSQAAAATTSGATGVRLTGFQVYDNATGEAVNTPKSYGKSIAVDDLPAGIARFFPVASADAPTAGSGLPHALLLPIMRAIREDIAEIREAFAQVELRMVGGSLLIVYEADWARAEEGVRALSEEEEEEEEDDDDDDEDDDENKKPGPPYDVKLIDFAHTRLKPGQGPDEGVLLGIDTVLTLLDGRIAKVEKDIAEDISRA